MTHDNPLSISEQVFISLFVAALMPLNNALNKSEACLSLLCETYIWGHAEVYLEHLFDVLWEAYLHTEEALCKARAWSAWFLSDSPTDLKETVPGLSDFTQSENLGIIQRVSNFPKNFQMYLCCSCLAAVVCYHCSVVECEGSSPWLWKENKKHRRKSDLQIKKMLFFFSFFNLTKHENRTCC